MHIMSTIIANKRHNMLISYM